MKVLVTGATGFIGQELVTCLTNHGYSLNITCRTKNTKVIDSRISVTQIENISSTTDWQSALEGCETVVHTAARAHLLNDKESEPLKAFRQVNVEGTLNLAKQAIQAGIKRFVFISSVGVHGNETKNKPFTELDYLSPHADYAVSKLEAEEKLRDLAAESDLEVVIIRPPLVYGENAPGNFKRLLSLVSKQIPLPLSMVKNKRSFIAKKNLVHFIMTCIEHPKAANETFLIADGEDISTPELIKMLSKGMNKPVRLLPFPLALLSLGSKLIKRQSMYQQLCGSLQIDISKARDLLDWQAPFTLEEAMHETAQNFVKVN